MQRIIWLLAFTLPCLLQAQTKYSAVIEAKIKQVQNNLHDDIAVEDEPGASLSARMQHFRVNGASIAVIKDYKLEWARGFGWADKEEKRPVTTATLFQAASMSKSLNALGIMKLVQEGKLDLLTDINHYLTSWQFPYDSLSHGKKINIANLLSHTAGLTVHGFGGYEKGDSIPSLIEILNGTAPANSPAVRSMFEPSLRAEYSGGGTMISQMIVEDITKTRYDKFMWENVLKPLGMNKSSFTQAAIRKDSLLLATGYHNDDNPFKGKFHIYPEQAPAGLWTNPSDLAKFIIEMQLSLTGKSNRILSQAMSMTMLTPYKNRSLGLGVFIDTIAGQVWFSHSGRNAGFVSRYVGSEDGGNGVIVMANTNDAAIVSEIINSVSIVYGWKDYYKPLIILMKRVLPDSVLNKYCGQYKITGLAKTSEGQFNLTDGNIITITKMDHHLTVQTGDDGPIEILPESDTVFFPKTSDTDIKFLKDQQDNFTQLTIHQNGQRILCLKIN